MNELILSKLDVHTLSGSGGVVGGFRRKVDATKFGTATADTETLSSADSGTLFTVNGTLDNIVNLPALSTSNVGLAYEFVWTVANASGKTCTFVLPGAGVSNFYAVINLSGATGVATQTYAVAGDVLTIPAAVVAGASVILTCIADDGTNSTWTAVTVSSVIATVA
tara:strand:+ start:12569 stop:13066 length:498 start_codon:yes stop_codon:yes gene_type:complete